MTRPAYRVLDQGRTVVIVDHAITLLRRPVELDQHMRRALLVATENRYLWGLVRRYHITKNRNGPEGVTIGRFTLRALRLRYTLDHGKDTQ